MASRLVALLTLLLSFSAGAIVLETLSVDSLTAQSDLVLHGVVLSNTCQRDPSGRIYTKVQLDVRDIWKGSVSGSPFSIVHSGGVLGDRQALVPAQVRYDVGEEVVAFLTRNERGEGVTIGLMQGKFRIWKDAKTGTHYVASPFHGVPEEHSGVVTSRSSSHPTSMAAPIRLTDFKKEVQGALR